MRPKHISLLLAIVGIVTFPTAASAYIDPGAGSLLLQGALGVVAVGVAVVGAYWRKVRDFIVRLTASRE